MRKYLISPLFVQSYNFHHLPILDEDKEYGKKIFTSEHITFPVVITITLFISIMCIIVGKITDDHIQKKKVRSSIYSSTSQQYHHKDSTNTTCFHSNRKTQENDSDG